MLKTFTRSQIWSCFFTIDLGRICDYLVFLRRYVPCMPRVKSKRSGIMWKDMLCVSLWEAYLVSHLKFSHDKSDRRTAICADLWKHIPVDYKVQASKVSNFFLGKKVMDIQNVSGMTYYLSTVMKWLLYNHSIISTLVEHSVKSSDAYFF